MLMPGPPPPRQVELQVNDEAGAGQVTMDHMIEIVAEPWADAFKPEVCFQAWLKIGIRPFTRLPLTNQYKKEWQANQQLKSTGQVPFVRRDLKYLFPPTSRKDLPDDLKGKRIRSGDIALAGPATAATVLAAIRAQDGSKRKAEEEKEGNRQARRAKKERVAEAGGRIWAGVVKGERTIAGLKGHECDAVAAYKGHRFECPEGEPLAYVSVGAKRLQLGVKFAAELTPVAAGIAES